MNLKGAVLICRVVARLNWKRESYILLIGITATMSLVVFLWWPLVAEYFSYWDTSRPIWTQIDWLLVGVFALMFLLIMVDTNLKEDGWIMLVGLLGGILIESWGTWTGLWHYYTMERPPLWILPAWPVASLAIDHLYHLLNRLTASWSSALIKFIYPLVFYSFYILMLDYVWPTIDQSLTQIALALCAFVILTPSEPRAAVLIFIAGAGMGYLLELWGTTRECWTYYTLAKPPIFAVMAHGMAAVSFWRLARIIRTVHPRFARVKMIRQIN